MARKKHNFESASKRLDEIIELMRGGEEGLDKMLALYTEGIELSDFCAKSIKQTERQVKILRKTSAGDFVLEEFIESGD